MVLKLSRYDTKIIVLMSFGFSMSSGMIRTKRILCYKFWCKQVNMPIPSTMTLGLALWIYFDREERKFKEKNNIIRRRKKFKYPPHVISQNPKITFFFSSAAWWFPFLFIVLFQKPISPLTIPPFLPEVVSPTIAYKCRCWPSVSNHYLSDSTLRPSKLYAFAMSSIIATTTMNGWPSPLNIDLSLTSILLTSSRL